MLADDFVDDPGTVEHEPDFGTKSQRCHFSIEISGTALGLQASGVQPAICAKPIHAKWQAMQMSGCESLMKY